MCSVRFFVSIVLALVTVGCAEQAPPTETVAHVIVAKPPKVKAPAVPPKPTASQLAANGRVERKARRKAAAEAKRIAREAAHAKLIQGIVDCEPKTVREATAAGADVNRPNEDGDHPLFLAAYRGDRNVIEPLVRAGSSINGKSHDGSTPLDEASQEGHAALAEYLRARGGRMGDRGDQGMAELPYDGDDHWNNPNS